MLVSTERNLNMTPEAKAKLKNLLVNNESYKQFPYTDITGHLTIGIGRNLSDRGISTTEALQLLDDDIIYFISKLSHYVSFFYELSDNRKIVLVDMCFNLGINGFLQFQNMLQALENKDYETAAKEILNSKAAEQCPERYQQLADIMRTDEL
jgi:lysozyme